MPFCSGSLIRSSGCKENREWSQSLNWRIYALVSCLVLVSSTFIPRLRPSSICLPVRAALLGFAISSSLIWMILFSILRYAIPIEALTGWMLTETVRDICSAMGAERIRKITFRLLSAGVVCLAAMTTHYPGFGHTHFTARTFDVAPLPLPENSIVLLEGRNLFYFGPSAQNTETATFIGLNDMLKNGLHHRPGQRARAILSEAGRPVFLLRKDYLNDDDNFTGLLGILIPGATVTDCRLAPSVLQRRKKYPPDLQDRVLLCRVKRPARGRFEKPLGSGVAGVFPSLR